MAISWLRIFIATLKMYSQTGLTDRAYLRAIYKISSLSDTYSRFYRPIKAENGDKNTYYVFLLQFLDFIGLQNRLGCQIGIKFSEQSSNLPFWRSWKFQLDRPR